ncbi:MAG: quinate 5-dehydrogenase [Candidatus Makaraimicrobium thalassicum]|nr:MAG: quinate 5-dehydrogenase [Candidatus Omnitrophota bacterium]
MKRAVSVSIGSSERDKAVTVELMGEEVSIERIGTDGDLDKAAQLFNELDGTIDAFGLGGGDFGTEFAGKYFKYHNVAWIADGAKKTPAVDGSGLRNTLEARLAGFIEEEIGDYINPKTVLLTAASDRWGMTKSFIDAGYECVFGELMFGLGIPIPMRKVSSLKLLATLLYPIVMRLPFEWIYPTGDKQTVREPKFEKYYEWASVIGGDNNYIIRHLPEKLEGKVIVTNTTTESDIKIYRDAGIKYLITGTPAIDGRSFGTNMMEAAFIAVSGKNRKLTDDELNKMLDELDFKPQIRELN